MVDARAAVLSSVAILLVTLTGGPALRKGPRAFRRHALKVWAKISPQRI